MCSPPVSTQRPGIRRQVGVLQWPFQWHLRQPRVIKCRASGVGGCFPRVSAPALHSVHVTLRWFCACRSAPHLPPSLITSPHTVYEHQLWELSVCIASVNDPHTLLLADILLAISPLSVPLSEFTPPMLPVNTPSHTPQSCAL
jgi:hypothetical protein